MSTLPGIVTVYEAAEMLEVSHAQAARYVRGGSLPATKIGNQWVIKEQDVKNFKKPAVGNPKWVNKKAKKK